jgi:Tfp pilus assembly protein PilZ
MVTVVDRDGAELPRAFPRFEVDAYVDVSGGEVLKYHRIQNVSLGGICIQTPALAEIGSPVDVVLNFPDLGAQLQLRGQIAWTNREPPQDVGIRWVALDDERRELLKKYISMVKAREIDTIGPA